MNFQHVATVHHVIEYLDEFYHVRLQI